MSYYFHAAAIDYDGTLSETPWPRADVLAAVREIREAGRKCILVTGRILAELRADFPDVDRHFDAIVAENGAVLAIPGEAEQLLAYPVAAELEHALIARQVRLRRGQVLLATEDVYDWVVNAEIGRLGLEDTIVRNRHALMVLPSGVTKGSGVIAALEALNLSPHSTVGIGDAENDHSLLDACEIGVAVANAVPALKAHAEVTLDMPNGSGIAPFLRGPFLEGLPGVEPQRRRIVLGHFADGTLATIPSSRVSVAIHGPSGSGKSYMAGLIAEQLVRARYGACVLDLEGDHVGLGEMHGVVALGGRVPLPPPQEVATLLIHGPGAVVVDLSLRDDDMKRRYAADLLALLDAARRDTGIPHWMIVDEAHLPMPSGGGGWWCRDAGEPGLCVITYRPALLCHHVAANADYVISLDATGAASLAHRSWDQPRVFTPVARDVGHVRHWHKYTEGQLPAHRHFHFRDRRGLTGRSAANVQDFLHEVVAIHPEVMLHHAGRGDFSRWLGDLSRDTEMVAAVREIEGAVSRSPADVTGLRRRLHDTVRDRFTPT